MRRAAATVALDWSESATVPNDLDDPELGPRRADARHVVARRDGGGDVGFCLEHKSTPDRWTAVQMHRYTAIEWMRCIDGAPSAPLPPLIAVVVHHGPLPWRVPTSIGELLAPPPPGLPPQPTFSFVLVDLALCTEGDLMRLGLLPLGTLALLYLQCLRRLGADDADAALGRWTLVFRAAAATSHHTAFEVFHRYALEVTDLARDRLAARMAAILGPEAGHAVMSTADQLRAEGRTLGRTEGRTEGKIEGKIEGRAELLFCLLQQRFGPAAEAIAARLRNASGEQLDRWALRLLDAVSIDAVFTDR